MRKFISIAVEQRKVILFISLVVVIFGMYSYYVIPKQENPHIKVTASMITTVYPGASPEDMEQLVTKKIEDAASEISEYKHVSSESVKNVSVVIIAYNDDADIDKANKELREKIDKVKPELPSGSMEPEIDTDLAEAAGILISLSGDNYSYEQLSFYGEEIKNLLGEIDGIYKIKLLGNVGEQVTVKVEVEKLNQFDLSLSEVSQMLHLQNMELLGGALENEGGKTFIKTKALYQSLEDIKNTIIKVSSETRAVVRLKDIASVEMELKDDVEKCKEGEKNAVVIGGYFKEDRNIIPIGKKVREAIEVAKKDFPQDLYLTEVTFQPEDVSRNMKDFTLNLIKGMGLVIIVIFLGMGFRNAAVVSLGIPFTIMVTFVLMKATHVTLQSASLAGLIIALGMIVDNAIVISDAVEVRYLSGESKKNAAINATSSAVMPVFMSTLTTVAAFIPLLFIPGDVGSFISSLPKVVIFALTASFISAVFVVPAMLSLIIGEKKTKKTKESIVKERFMSLLELVLRQKSAAAVILILLFISSVALVMPQLRVAFFPKADKNLIYIETFTEKPGDLKHTEKIADQINQLVYQQPEIVNVTTGIGTSLPKFYTTMVPLADKDNHTRAILKFDLSKSDRFITRSELAFYIQEVLNSNIIGAASTVKLLEMTDPESAPVEIRLSGKDLNRLKEVSQQFEKVLRDIPGTINVNSNAAEHTYEYIVDVDTDKASLVGVLNSDIQQEIQIALLGNKSSVYRKEGKEYDIRVMSDINSVSQLENMAIKSSVTNNKVLLKQIAQIKIEPQIDSVKRYNKIRSVFVTCDVKPNYSPLDISNYIEH